MFISLFICCICVILLVFLYFLHLNVELVHSKCVFYLFTDFIQLLLFFKVLFLFKLLRRLSISDLPTMLGTTRIAITVSYLLFSIIVSSQILSLYIFLITKQVFIIYLLSILIATSCITVIHLVVVKLCSRCYNVCYCAMAALKGFFKC